MANVQTRRLVVAAVSAVLSSGGLAACTSVSDSHKYTDVFADYIKSTSTSTLQPTHDYVFTSVKAENPTMKYTKYAVGFTDKGKPDSLTWATEELNTVLFPLGGKQPDELVGKRLSTSYEIKDTRFPMQIYDSFKYAEITPAQESEFWNKVADALARNNMPTDVSSDAAVYICKKAMKSDRFAETLDRAVALRSSGRVRVGVDPNPSVIRTPARYFILSTFGFPRRFIMTAGAPTLEWF